MLLAFDGASLTELVRAMFAAGEQGAWYDPSDLTTMYQDAAGTTPVTALGQPVGLALDKRLGLPLGPELVTNGDFSSGTTGWTVAGGTLSTSAGVLVITSIGAGYNARAMQSFTTVVGVTYKVSYTAGAVYATGARVGTTAGATDILSFTGTAGAINTLYFRATSTTTHLSLVGSATNGVTATADNVTVKEIAGNHAYQATAASRPTLQIDSNGMYYLSFDGVDDGMATPSINFTGTDKMTVWAGYRKLSDAAVGIVCELSASSASNSGAFRITAPGSNGVASVNFVSGGTTAQSASSTGVLSPVTVVETGIGDIAGDMAQMRINGAVAATTTGDQGTGNYGNYPLYIGRRGGTTLPFNGRLYGLIIRGAASNAGQIAQTEQYMNSKTRAY